MNRKVICALDTGDLGEAIATVRRLGTHVGAFKIGHALTLPNGLDVVPRLQDAGATRIFLDLKFHDIPNSVALAVREAAKRGVWMMTVHIAGGPAMISAAVEESRARVDEVPLIVGVSVLTSLDQHILTNDLGVDRSIEDHMVRLSRMGIQCGLHGVVSSPHEVSAIRGAIGHEGVIVVPGVRPQGGDAHDQRRVGSADQALADGANYLVIGRALTESADVDATLQSMGLEAHVA